MSEASSSSDISSDSLYASASTLIESAQLSALEHLQLTLFLIHAVVPSEAAQFILRTSRNSEKSIEDTLRSINKGLKTLARKFSSDDPVPQHVDAALREREKGLCCVEGSHSDLRATYIVPPSIIDDEDLQSGGALRPLLEAAISTEVAHKLFSFLRSNSKEDQLKNLWLMSPSVRTAFRGGRLGMKRIQFENDDNSIWVIDTKRPGETFGAEGVHNKFYVKPSSPDPRLPLPAGFLLSVHTTTTYPMRLLTVEEGINHGWPVEKENRTLGKTEIRIIRGLFSVLPAFLVSMLYCLILKAIEFWGPQEHPYVKILPFGVCLKTGPRVSENEAKSLLLIEKHTTIMAPRLINMTLNQGVRGGYLLMTRVPGIPADQVFYRMTYEERNQLAKDLGKCIAQYRRIPNQNKYLICNTVSGPVTDHRTRTFEPCGPYNSKADFLDHLTEGLEDQRIKRPISFLYENKHQIFFTHSDLHLSNLLVQAGRLSGIVDWENSGFKPEYWDYTRAVWAYMSDKQLAYEFSLAFDKDYGEELEAERVLWRLKPVY